MNNTLQNEFSSAWRCGWLAALTLALSACGGGDGAPGSTGAAGTSGKNLASRSSAEPVGATCPAGGVRIETGLDMNVSGVLEDSEVQVTSYTCNGAAGTSGQNGEPGTPGIPVTPGAPGQNSLIRTTVEPAGANCEAGGVRLQTGLDSSGNGVLEAGEVQSTSYVCSVSIPSARSWRSPVLLETADGAAFDPKVAFDAGGNAMAVWAQRNSNGVPGSAIWASRFTASANNWEAAVLVGPNAADAFFNAPQIQFDARGNALMIWKQVSQNKFRIAVSRYSAITRWGTAQLIDTFSIVGASNPKITVNGSGSAFAVWAQSDGIRDDIWSNDYVPGLGWGVAKLIETDPNFAGSTGSPEIAIDIDGNALAVWGQFESIYANRYTKGIGWGNAERLDAGPFVAYSPKIATDAAGNALAVWSKSDGNFGQNVAFNRYTSGVGWGVAALIEAGKRDARLAEIAVQPNGVALAVWVEFSSAGSNSVKASRFAPFGGWIEPKVLIAGGKSPLYPQIATNTNGDAIVVWKRYTDNGVGFWSNRYSRDSGWGEAEPIDNTVFPLTGIPAQIAIDPIGNGIAVSTRFDGTTSNLWANSFR